MVENTIRLKRTRDAPEPADGIRVLVDRVWPRGIRKTDLKHDHWLKEVAPSTELRKWFRHDPDRWPEFRERYRRELADKPEAVGPLMEMCRAGPVTLLFSARDRDRNQAVVLREYLLERLESDARDDPASSPCSANDFPQHR